MLLDLKVSALEPIRQLRNAVNWIKLMDVGQIGVRSNSEMESGGYRRLLGILIRRRSWLIGGLMSSVAIAGLLTLWQKPTFVSTMRLLVEPNYQSKRDGQGQSPEPFADPNVETDLATQMSLIQSSELLRKAMALLYPEYSDLNPSDPGSVSAFQKSLSLTQITRSSEGNKKEPTKIFEVTYSSHDAVKTQRVLQALQKVYLDYNQQQQQKRLAKGLSFVNEQLPQISAKVERSQAALEQFRTQQGLIDPEVQAKTKIEALSKIEQEQQTNQVEVEELQGRYDSLQQKVAFSPQQAIQAARLSQSARYQNLLSEIQKTELALQQERSRFQEKAPFVQRIETQRQDQLDLLKAELNRFVGSDAAPGTEDALRSKGNLSALDVDLIRQLVETQVNLQAAIIRRQALAEEAQKVRADVKQFPKLLAENQRLEPEVKLNGETLDRLLKAQQELGLESARGGFDWQVVEAPQIGLKTAPDLKKNLLLGAVVGLFAGGIAAMMREAADDSVHSSEELKQQVEVPLLGGVPSLSLNSVEPQSRLQLPFRKVESPAPAIAQVIHWHPFQDAMDRIYQQIQLSSPDQVLSSIVVTSALAGEGKTTLALGLAMSAARIHQRVLLIDADLRRPSLHQLLDLDNDTGLSTLLAGAAPVFSQLNPQRSNLRNNLSILTAGPRPADPIKLLSSQRMRDLIAKVENTYDLVVLDAPSVLGAVDLTLSAACCDGVVLVSRLGQVSRAELTETTTVLSKLNLVGMVANGLDAAHTVRRHPEPSWASMLSNSDADFN